MFLSSCSYCNHRIMKFNSKGKLAEVWEAPVEGKNMFVPHKAILNAAQDLLYVADRENKRILSFVISEGGRGVVFSNNRQLRGNPYSICFNDSQNDWPMYGVLGGFSMEKLMGFTLDKSGTRTATWGPKEVCIQWNPS